MNCRQFLMEINLGFVCVSSDCLEDCWEVRALLNQGLSGCQLLEVWKQLREFVNWLQETIE
jgi:hypothetical protein